MKEHQSVVLSPNRPSIRARNFVPCFLYDSDPAIMNASQIRDALTFAGGNRLNVSLQV